MSLINQFCCLAIISGILNVVFSIIVVHKLSKRAVKINFFLLRFLLPKYVHQYKTITLEETGSVGALFYCWIGSINLALGFSIVALLIKFL